MYMHSCLEEAELKRIVRDNSYYEQIENTQIDSLCEIIIIRRITKGGGIPCRFLFYTLF